MLAETVTAAPRTSTASRSVGASLPMALQSTLQPNFSFDLSRVQTHCDVDAAELTGAYRARAMTVGEHIYFGPRHAPGFDPVTLHELAHVEQQHGARGRPMGTDRGALEADADRVSAALLRGESAAPTMRAPSGGVQLAAEPAAAAATPERPQSRLVPADDSTRKQWVHVATAIAFLNDSGLPLLPQLEAALLARGENLHIRINDQNAAGFHYYRDYEYHDALRAQKVRGVLTWNPFIGLQIPSGEILSPAEVFYHEAAHALQYTEHTDQFVEQTDGLSHTDDGFSNPEEKRTIQGIETPASAIVGPKLGRRAGALVRNHVDGKFVRVIGPLSITPAR